MPLYVLPALTFVTILLIGVALAQPGETVLQRRLRTYGYDLSQQAGGDLSRPLWERLFLPLVHGVLRIFYRLSPTGFERETRRRLQQAGLTNRLSPATFIVIRLVMALIVPVVVGLPRIISGRSFDTFSLVAILIGGYLGWRLPDIVLSFKIDNRKNEIRKRLPDAIDLIVVCVEAGYALEAAMQKVIERIGGPISEEFQRTLAEISLGKPRAQALKDMSDRIGQEDVQSFIAAILQADKMGVRIALVLRTQSDSMRVRRRQRAQEAAARAAVKVLFPLMTMIFPAMMLVILGPAVMRIAEFFRNLFGG